MRLNDWIADMERIAPPELALAWDNVGLLVSPETERIERVLVALDCTAEVADEAADCGAQLVLTHHPVLFSGANASSGTRRIPPPSTGSSAAGWGCTRRIRTWTPRPAA